jgi:hypothetical protein
MTPSSLLDESKHRTKSIIVSLKYRIDARPKLKRYILWFFKPFPGLKNKFKSIRPANKLAYLTMKRIDNPEQLPQQARKIYDKLEKSVNKQERGAQCESL